MSCHDCEVETEIVEHDRIAYVRVGNGNVAIIGCDQHLRELIALLRAARAEKKAEEP